jgi:carbon storage regulator
MLVLTRKTNESVVIAGGIEVMVVQVRGNRVRLGFRAPADVAIQRRECVGSPAGRPHEGRSVDDESRPIVTVAAIPDRSRTAILPR